MWNVHHNSTVARALFFLAVLQRLAAPQILFDYNGVIPGFASLEARASNVVGLEGLLMAIGMFCIEYAAVQYRQCV